MITTAITAAGFATAGLVFLALKFGNNFVKRLLGYDWAVDVAVTFTLAWMFAIGGTISGMLTGIITGVFISILLIIAKRVIGYQRLELTDDGLQWKEEKGEWEDKVREAFSSPSSLQNARRAGPDEVYA